jgi:hypothetical protein
VVKALGILEKKRTAMLEKSSSQSTGAGEVQ